MARIRHLSKAPITEVIVDFRVKARQGLQAKEFAALKPELAHRFPDVREQRQVKAEFRLGPKEGPLQQATEVGVRGLLFKSGDGCEIAQFRIDGFTFNRLHPYTSWEEISPVAFELWRKYVDVAQPQMVTRLALRYLNHIDLLPSLIDFDEIMVAPPPIPERLPQAVSRFLTRVTIHDHEQDLTAHVTQAFEGAPGPGKGKLILDIDAFREKDVPVESEEVAGTFSALHEFKNRVFFESLTEEAIGRLE
jgi:uncharacterized protein (TIGR04255 family)